MGPTLIALWLAVSGKACPRPAPRRRPASRPRLEALEDRLTPSGLAGTLDTSFNSTGSPPGVVTTSIPGFSPYTGGIRNPHDAIDPSGRVVVAGGTAYPNDGSFYIARYNVNGSLDTSFNSHGSTPGTLVANWGFTGSGWSPITLSAVAVQPDAKIVVTGFQSYSGSSDQLPVFGLERFNADGSADTTFGSGGLVIRRTGTAGSQGEFATSLALDTQGRVVAAGQYQTASAAPLLVERFTPNGQLDGTFGNGGQVEAYYGTTTYSVVNGLAIDAGGNIVVAGLGTTTNSSGTGQVMGAARLTSDGRLDPTFNPTGSNPGTQTFTVLSAPGQSVSGLALESVAGMQKVVIGGTVADSSGSGIDGVLARLNPDGGLDASFGNGGIVANTLGGTVLRSVVAQGDGKIVTTGNGQSNGPALVRYNADGTLDTTFNSAGPTPGVAQLLVGTGADIGLNGSAINPFTGDVVESGETSFSSTDARIFVASFNTVGSPSFVVSGFPSPTTAGTSGYFTVTADDGNGNILTGYTGTVHFTSSDPRAVLPSDYTFTVADQGAHTFTAAPRTAGSQWITAADTVTSGISGSESGIVVQPAAAAKFVLGAPASVTHGSEFSLTLTVEDTYGNVVTGYVGTVHFSSSDSTATLPKNYAFTAADAGLHTFTGVILRKRGTQSITVIDTRNGDLTATDDITVV